jgi:hypothetical protein
MKPPGATTALAEESRSKTGVVGQEPAAQERGKIPKLRAGFFRYGEADERARCESEGTTTGTEPPPDSGPFI